MTILVSLEVLVGLCNTLLCVKKYIMEPNVFLGYLKSGVACSLNIFCHKQYPKQGIDLFVGFGKALNYPSTFQVMEPNVFMR